MTEHQTEALSLKAAYEFGGAHCLEREVREIREMIVEWDSRGLYWVSNRIDNQQRRKLCCHQNCNKSKSKSRQNRHI